MGNSNSGFQGSVQVALERRQYHAGDTVTGYVQVQATGELQATDLIAHLHGETRTCVHYTRTHTSHHTVNGKSQSRTHTTHHTAYQRFTFVAESRFVAKFADNKAPSGMYQFPFSFQLHPALPSSVYVEGRDHASIMYGVEVRLNRPGFFQPTLVHKAMFDMIAHVPHPVTPQYTMDKQAVNCCCCIGKGSIMMSAALERNAFRSNEPITVRIQLHNESSSEVQCIVVEVHEDAWFTAQGHRAHRARTIAEARLPEPIPAGGGFGENLGTDPKVVSIRLPPFNHCTLRSPLLSITHVVRVRADTPFGITNPSIDLPVTLHRSGLVQAAFAPPLHDGEEFGFGAPIDYKPNPSAMHSPIPVELTPSAPVAPWIDQPAPVQEQMDGGWAPAAEAPGVVRAIAVDSQALQQQGNIEFSQQALQQPGAYEPSMQQLSSNQYSGEPYPSIPLAKAMPVAQAYSGSAQMPVAQATPTYRQQADLKQPLMPPPS